ncbi:MAG: hypothetical protein WC028_30970 [Candidatus Obscuribacterales bacterium]|jgi:hypothetical protein
MTETLTEVAARLRVARLADIAPDDPRFAQVEYMVEADNFVYHTLWSTWHESIKWQPDAAGRMVGLGILIGRNVNVEVRFARLNGHMVMFYYPCSQLVDYTMVDSFIEDVRKLGLAARPGSEPAGKSDATAFHNCVHFCNPS